MRLIVYSIVTRNLLLLQDTVFNWAGGATKDERALFLKRFLDLLPEVELNGVLKLVSKCKRRRKRKSLPNEDYSESKTREEPVSVPGIITVPVSAPGSPGPPRRWWKRWQKADVLAMDIEKVEVPTGLRKPKYISKAAEVAIINSNYEIIYRKKIFHAPGTFRVNPYAKNGFNTCSLAKGELLSTVQNEISQILERKLVILVAAEGDFSSLDLPMGDYDVFDLQWEW
jgi:hypothetical protein